MKDKIDCFVLRARNDIKFELSDSLFRLPYNDNLQIEVKNLSHNSLETLDIKNRWGAQYRAARAKRYL